MQVTNDIKDCYTSVGSTIRVDLLSLAVALKRVSLGANEVANRGYDGFDLATTAIMVVDNPSFFTPNGDGYHDTWNIVGIDGLQNAKIFIFDRYGKLLKQISPSGDGWDGTYNGSPMPTSDYWFVIEYQEQQSQTSKEFKAHFTLKR